MSRELKLGKHEKGLDAAMEKVIVAVKAAKEVPKNALVWALTHVVQPGGFGSVHRGVLPNGQTVAVKQYKLPSTQGDQEFSSEVEILSCAQHRNVVMLIGFCIEDGRSNDDIYVWVLLDGSFGEPDVDDCK
ncbi:hypothetical protein AgCh_035893 [Apium graveolens]